MDSDDQNNEVEFWLDLITRWEASNSDPVPERMREALMMAQLKSIYLKEQISLGPN